REMQRRGEPGEAAADDQHLDVGLHKPLSAGRATPHIAQFTTADNSAVQWTFFAARSCAIALALRPHFLYAARVGVGIDMQVSTCISCRAIDADKVFKALADPSRRKLLDVLHGGDGQTLGELCEHLDEMTRQAVTQHLAVLEAANLVATTWRGREKL